MQSTSPWWSAACAVLQLQMLLVEYGCAPKVVHQVRGITSLGGDDGLT